MTYIFIVYDRQSLEKVGEIRTDHSISFDDALNFLDAARIDTIHSDDPDLLINGRHYWYYDLDITLEDNYNFKVEFNNLLNKCVTKNASGRECFALEMLDDDDIQWMADNCPSWDWLYDVTDDAGNNLYKIAEEKGFIE